MYPPSRDGGRRSFLSTSTDLATGERVFRNAAEAARKKMRHTRDHRTSSPVAYFALHRKGFAVPPPLLTSAVGSYPTFSP